VSAGVVAWKTFGQDLQSLNLSRVGSPDGHRSQPDDVLGAVGLSGSLLGQTSRLTGPDVAPGASLPYYGLETLSPNGIIPTIGQVSVRTWPGTTPHPDLPIAPG